MCNLLWSNSSSCSMQAAQFSDDGDLDACAEAGWTTSPKSIPSSERINSRFLFMNSWTALGWWDEYGMNMGWIWMNMDEWRIDMVDMDWYMDWWCLGWLMSDDSSSHQSSPNFIPRPWISSGNNLRSRPNARIGGVAGDHLGNSTSWNPANNGVWFYRDTIGLADRLCLINFNHF